ncbi:MAG: hypothetical protein WDZ35_00395 [Crocinitomicaceae bacterium]
MKIKLRSYFTSSGFILTATGVLLGLLIAVLTFPENNWTYGAGIDPPLAWIFNHLFAEGSSLAQNFIFPHGALAFFMYPLPVNIWWVVIVTALLKISLVFNVFSLTEKRDNSSWLIAFLAAYFLALTSGFTHLLLANILLLLCNFYSHQKWGFKLLAFFLVAFSFYVKSYVGILSGMIAFSFIIYRFVVERSWKELAINVGSLFAFLLLFWGLLFKDFSGFFRAFYGLIQLAGDNSSAVAYYPVNNWWFLAVFFLGVVSLIFLNRNRRALYFFVLCGLSLFGAWKHGMARMDSSHVDGLWSYFVLVLFIFIFFNRKKILQNTVISLIALLFLGGNMRNAEGYYPSKIELLKANNFFEFLSDYDRLIENAEKISRSNVAHNQLSPEFLAAIGNETVDVYPCDYSIIAANRLNWQPRPVLHSYAAYTSWLDEQNATHFESDQAPEFLIWKIESAHPGLNGNLFSSIDHRYLLNDEPQTLIALMRHYTLLQKEGDFLLYKRQNTPLEIKRKLVKSTNCRWNEWVQVPDYKQDLLRVNVRTTKTCLLALKSFLYKDEQFWVDLKCADESIHQYRFVPKNAEYGLWINPYLTEPGVSKQVNFIRFRSSRDKWMKESILLDWESIELEYGHTQTAEKFFQSFAQQQDSLIFSSINHFESDKKPFWMIENSSLIKDSEENFIQKVDSNSMSAILDFPLDSLSGAFHLTFGSTIKAADYAYTKKILLIIALNKNDENLIWKGIPIDRQLINCESWNPVINHLSFQTDGYGYRIRASLWNTSNYPIHIKYFRFHLYKTP